MHITIIDKEEGRRLSSLKPGNCFVRNAQKRPLVGRSVYMILHHHSRLERFKRIPSDIVCVNLGTGHIDRMSPEQHILELNGGVEMGVVE